MKDEKLIIGKKELVKANKLISAKDKEIAELKQENKELSQTASTTHGMLQKEISDLKKEIENWKQFCEAWVKANDKLREQKLAQRDKEWVGKIDDVASHVNAIIVGLQNDIECGELDENIEHNLNEMNKIVDKLNKLKSEMGVKE